MRREEIRNESSMAFFISMQRAALLDAIEEKSKIGPADWHIVHEVISELLRSALMSYTRALILTTTEMTRLMDGEERDSRLGEKLFNENIEGVIMSTVLMAHMDVLKETGCRMNDAHLHFGRVRRAADKEVRVASMEIFNPNGGHND